MVTAATTPADPNDDGGKFYRLADQQRHRVRLEVERRAHRRAYLADRKRIADAIEGVSEFRTELGLFAPGYAECWLLLGSAIEDVLPFMASANAKHSGTPEDQFVEEMLSRARQRPDQPSFTAFMQESLQTFGIGPHATGPELLDRSTVDQALTRVREACFELIEQKYYRDAKRRSRPTGATAARTDSAAGTPRSNVAPVAGRKPPGRPPDTDPAADARLSEAWQTGEHTTYANLASALSMDEREVKKAIDRERKRRSSARKSSAP